MEIARALVLVVDDEPSICWALQRLLEGQGHEVLTASNAEDGLQIAREREPALVLLDVRLPREDGISALPKFRDIAPDVPVIVMTAFGDLQTAIAAVQNGASDYLIKPFKLDEVARAVATNLRGSQSRAQVVGDTTASDAAELRIVGSSSAIQRAFHQIALVASSDLSVLITGETGTGKELVAEAIHRHGSRRDQTYVAIAPVALNADLIESELFGHVKGAFTGATETRAGLFEQAEGGTVLLDEIGELPLAVQAKLLRVLERGEYFRVGEVTPRQCNVRILAATNSDLHAAVVEQRFREDLYYRLNGMHIHLPPLRERREDIEPLCKYFLDRCAYSGPRALDSDLVAELAMRPWYGNVRELRNAIEHATIVARGRPLQLVDFPEPHAFLADAPLISLEQSTEAWGRAAIERMQENSQPLHAQFLGAAEPTLLRLAIEHTGGNRVKAAELLGMHRGTLRDRMRAYGMDDS